MSTQEAAIQAGKVTLHGTVTDRVLRMYEAIRAYGTVRVTLDRACLFTESFKETESQPLVLRWAKALKHFVENVPVTIFPDELLVGRPNTWFGKWGIVYPELDGSVMPAGVEMFKKNKGKPGDVTVTEEDDKIISEVLTPYWAGKDYSTNFIKSLPEETRFVLYGPDPNNLLMQTVVIFASLFHAPLAELDARFHEDSDARRQGDPRGGPGEAGRALRARVTSSTRSRSSMPSS